MHATIIAGTFINDIYQIAQPVNVELLQSFILNDDTIIMLETGNPDLIELALSPFKRCQLLDAEIKTVPLQSISLNDLSKLPSCELQIKGRCYVWQIDHRGFTPKQNQDSYFFKKISFKRLEEIMDDIRFSRIANRYHSSQIATNSSIHTDPAIRL